MTINTDDTFEIKAYQIMVYMRISRFLKLKVVIDEIKKPANHFWNAYSDTITHPLVTEFFQKFSALNMWSNMRNNANVSTFNDRKLELLMVLSKTPLIA